MAENSKFFEIAGLVTSIAGVIVIAMSSRKSSSSSSSSDGDGADSSPARPDRWLDPGQSFLLLGDSIGVGIQKALNDLSNSYGTTLTSMVKTGSTAGYWNRHVEPGDSGFPVIVLSLGSNDAALADLDAEGPDICNLIAQLSERGAHVLWFLPPSFRKDALTAKQARFAQLITECGAIQLDLLGPQPSVASDYQMHLHLTPDGYRVLAAQIFDALTRHDGLREGAADPRKRRMEKRYDCGTHHLPSGEQSSHRLDFPECERLLRLEVEGACDEFWFEFRYHTPRHSQIGYYGETVPLGELDGSKRIVLIPERYVCDAGSHVILTLGNQDYPGKNFDDPFDLKVTVVTAPAQNSGA